MAQPSTEYRINIEDETIEKTSYRKYILIFFQLIFVWICSLNTSNWIVNQIPQHDKDKTINEIIGDYNRSVQLYSRQFHQCTSNHSIHCLGLYKQAFKEQTNQYYANSEDNNRLLQNQALRVYIAEEYILKILKNHTIGQASICSSGELQMLKHYNLKLFANGTGIVSNLVDGINKWINNQTFTQGVRENELYHDKFARSMQKKLLNSWTLLRTAKIKDYSKILDETKSWDVQLREEFKTSLIEKMDEIKLELNRMSGITSNVIEESKNVAQLYIKLVNGINSLNPDVEDPSELRLYEKEMDSFKAFAKRFSYFEKRIANKYQQNSNKMMKLFTREIISSNKEISAQKDKASSQLSKLSNFASNYKPPHSYKQIQRNFEDATNEEDLYIQKLGQQKENGYPTNGYTLDEFLVSISNQNAPIRDQIEPIQPKNIELDWLSIFDLDIILWLEKIILLGKTFKLIALVVLKLRKTANQKLAFVDARYNQYQQYLTMLKKMVTRYFPSFVCSLVEKIWHSLAILIMISINLVLLFHFATKFQSWKRSISFEQIQSNKFFAQFKNNLLTPTVMNVARESGRQQRKIDIATFNTIASNDCTYFQRSRILRESKMTNLFTKLSERLQTLQNGSALAEKCINGSKYNAKRGDGRVLQSLVFNCSNVLQSSTIEGYCEKSWSCDQNLGANFDTLANQALHRILSTIFANLLHCASLIVVFILLLMFRKHIIKALQDRWWKEIFGNELHFIGDCNESGVQSESSSTLLPIKAMQFSTDKKASSEKHFLISFIVFVQFLFAILFTYKIKS